MNSEDAHNACSWPKSSVLFTQYHPEVASGHFRLVILISFKLSRGST
jgi:hypothetical protein